MQWPGGELRDPQLVRLLPSLRPSSAGLLRISTSSARSRPANPSS